MVEEHMVVGAQAKDVFWGVRPVVRCAERADVCSFGVGAGETFQASSAHLASVAMKLLFLLCLPRIPYEA